MTDREKLSELLSPWLAHLSLCAADDLIAKGVTIPVRCKDCKKSGILEHNGKMFCNEPMGCLGCAPTKPDAFCAYGERRGNG